MTLLNSIALVAASALIVPILVHLRKRRKSRVVDWPAMQFLTRTMASRRRGLKLEEFLLLLLRCLIVLLFVFAMARPVIPSGQTLRWSLIAGLFAGGLVTLVASLVGQMTRARRASGIVVAALLLASATTLLKSHSLPLETWGADQDVAIVIDGSSTMMMQENSQSQFQQAIEKASALTRQLSGQSTVSIILAGPVSQTIEGSPFKNLRSAEQSLAGLKPTSGGSNLGQAIELARTAVSKGANPRRQIVVFTDNQLHNWESVADAAIAADDARNALDAASNPAQQKSNNNEPALTKGNDNADPVRYAAHVAKLPVDVVNLSVDSITVRSPVPTINRPIPCDVEITNHGSKTVRDLKLTLSLNGQPSTIETIAQLESGTSRTVRFLPVFTAAGSQVLQAKLEQPESVPAELREPLLEDNRAFSVIEVISNLKVLVVNGNSFANKTDQSATFAQLALDPLSLQDRRDNQEPVAKLPENSRPVQVQEVEVNELAAMDEPGVFQVILLCDVPRLPKAAATQLARYVSEGGRLWVIPEQSADTEFYNAWKSDEADEPVLPCQLMERYEHAANANAAADVDKAVSIASETAGTPWLKELFERGEHDLFDLTVSSCWKLAPRDRSVQHLRLTTDNPLFVEHTVGKGRVLLQSISLTQKDSNLISRVSFPVLMHLWTQSLTAGQSPETNLAPGSNLTVELSRRHGSSLNPVDDENEPAIAELTLVRPLSDVDEELISVDVDDRDGHAFVSIANAVTPGVYELRSKSDQTVLQSFTVTRDRKESDFAIASEEKLTELAANPAFQWFRDIDELTSPGITTDGGREIWKTLAFAVLWLLAAESLLIRWIRKRRMVPPSLHVVHNARLRFVLFTARAVMALIFWHQLLKLVSSLVETSRAWPVWLPAGSAAIASEIILLTYDPPVIAAVGTMRSWLPKSLVGLRLALVGLIAILLMEPALSREEEKNEERTIAVLVDASSSMTLPTRSGPDPKQSRSEVATNLLSSSDDPSSGLLARIREGYALKVYEFGATARELTVDGAAKTSPKANAPKTDQADAKTSAPKSQWAQSTDVAAALRRITEDTPTDQLSGVIMLTDGRDHSRTDVQESVRSFARQKIPVNSVVIGSQEPIRDADIISLDAPPQIYHGDSVSLQATLRADQLKGTTALVRLYEGESLLDERSVKIASDKHRESIRFRHEPEDARIHRYRVELSPLDGEETTDNNSASRNVWVSNDQIRVLLIEDRPRWEFRYLRNLFAGRDRTVFLQAVLLRPDRLAGVPVPPVVHASAGRAFDDCDATALPRSEAEWLKFDAVVLGDVSPEQLGPDGVQALVTFVRKKGGSLVVIAGQNFMPHAYRNSPLADLLPVKLTGPEFPTAKSPEPSCFLRTTTEGQAHVILQQSDGRPASALQQFPELSWRHPDCEARVGATVLAYAARLPRTDAGNDDQNNAVAEEPSQETQRRAALMAWHRFGAGKVLQLNFDESWRLRYGIGDRLHHQFWGQIIRWSVNERLSTGTDLVRMGTDRTLYHSGDPIIVQARLLDDQRNPVTDQPVKAILLKDNVPVRTIDLAPQVDRPGLLQAEIRDLADPGKYRVELQGDIVTRLLTQDAQKGENVGLEIGIESVTSDDELLDLVADPAIATQLADVTGGIVVTPEDSSAVLKHLGPTSTFHRKRWTVPLWNLWPVISIFLGGLSVEWILRRLLDSNSL